MGNWFIYERFCAYGQNKVAWTEFIGVCVDDGSGEAEEGVRNVVYGNKILVII